jgi:hypothetical protein
LEVTKLIKNSSACHHRVQNICAWFHIPQESSYPVCPATRPEAFCLPESASSLKFEIKAFNTLVDHLLVTKRRKLLSKVIGMGRERQERAKKREVSPRESSESLKASSLRNLAMISLVPRLSYAL